MCDCFWGTYESFYTSYFVLKYECDKLQHESKSKSIIFDFIIIQLENSKDRLFVTNKGLDHIWQSIFLVNQDFE
jgi:hypothetical protein